jgi:hypothetical protein
MKKNANTLSNHLFWLLIILVLLLSVIGCNTQSSTVPSAIHTKQSISPTKFIVTELAASTISPTTAIPAQTLSPQLTVVRSATFIATLTPTWAPILTLSKNQANARIYRLLENNGDCKLPCWFGIIPGVTSWREARNLLQPFSEVDNQDPYEVVIGTKVYQGSSHTITFPLPEGKKMGGAYIADLDGIISLIRVGEHTTAIGKFNLSSLLTEYGKPDQVFVDSTIHVPYTPFPFEILLYYQDQNILAKFNLDGKRQQESICAYPQDKGPQLWLWSNESKFELSQGAFPEWVLGTDEEKPLLIDQVTDLNTDSFYQTFKNSKYSGSICTPTD